MSKYLEDLNKSLILAKKSTYQREQYQSFMTGPEWRNVEMSEDLAKFLKDNNSIFNFPFFRQIADLWRVVGKSYSAARKYNSAREVLFSEYMVMDIFIAVFTTIELAPKGLLALMLSPFLSKTNETEMQQALAGYFLDYSKKLQTSAFYEHDYPAYRKDLAEKYNAIENKSWGDWFSWKLISLDLRLRHLICQPLKYFWYSETDNPVEPTTDVLVKLKVETDNPEVAKKELSSSLLKHLAEVKEDEGDEEVLKAPQVYDVYARDKKYSKDHISVYAHIQAPRYGTFQPLVEAMAAQDIHVRKIAGQNRVQVKCVAELDDAGKLPSVSQPEEAEGGKKRDIHYLYNYSNRIDPKHRICLFDVPAKNLDQSLAQLEEEIGPVQFIHNF